MGLYWPLPGEVDLISLRDRIDAPVALPRGDGRGGLEYLLWSGEELEPDGCQKFRRRAPALHCNRANSACC